MSEPTHCKRGHLYSDENTRIASNGSRVCKICQRATHRRWRDNRRYPFEYYLRQVENPPVGLSLLQIRQQYGYSQEDMASILRMPVELYKARERHNVLLRSEADILVELVSINRKVVDAKTFTLSDLACCILDDAA